MTNEKGYKITFGLVSLISKYKVITVTHHNINVQEIGHFYFFNNSSDDRINEGLQSIKDKFGIDECQYLETCNRVAYIFFADFELTDPFLVDFFHVVNPKLEKKTLSNIANFVTVYEGEAAIQHVFEMASSMDSLVVGEREIFRQYRTSYKMCRAIGHTSDNLRLLENSAVLTAKEVYSNTKIGEKPLSIVSLAFNALLKMQLLPTARILVVGAGETNALFCKFLKKYNFSNIKIYNRSLDNAEGLAKEIGANSYNIDQLSKVKGDFDVIVICTSANKVVIDNELYQQMLQEDSSEKVLIDLAVPRNISSAVVDKNLVNYIDIESLKKISEANLEFRRQEVIKARPIIKRNVQLFNERYGRRQIERAMGEVPSAISEVKNRALNMVYKDRIAALDPKSQELLMEIMDYMEKKCTSVPIKLAKSKVQPISQH